MDQFKLLHTVANLVDAVKYLELGDDINFQKYLKQARNGAMELSKSLSTPPSTETPTRRQFDIFDNCLVQHTNIEVTVPTTADFPVAEVRLTLTPEGYGQLFTMAHPMETDQ